MQERVLIPLDGSRVGEAALSAIESRMNRWAPDLEVEVTLLRAIPATHWIAAGDVGAPVRYTDEELQVLRQAALIYLDKAGEDLRAKGATVKAMVVVGNQADGILKAAEEIKADIIAMSTHGRSGLRRWAFGSITDKVLRGANVPVLTVRAPEGTVNE
jgi:nucleotide-binding universal stress UspA family protein